MSTYSGALHSKRKAELVEIAEALELQVLSGAPKFDYEDAIRDALRANKSLREDKKYSGLWAAMPDSVEESTFAGETSDEDQIRRKPTSRAASSGGRTPRKSTARQNLALPPSVSDVANAVQEVASQVKEQAQAVVHDLAEDARALVPSSGTPGRLGRTTGQMRLYVKKSSGNLRKAAEDSAVAVRENTVETIVKTQDILSHPWSVVTALTAAEISYLAYAAIPWAYKTYGPHKWATLRDTSAFAVPYPDLSVLLHPTFTKSFLKWSFLTIFIPMIISVVLAFPDHSNHARRTRAQSKTVAPPNALSFAIARLCISILIGYIFARPVSKVEWSFESVEGFPAIQLLGSAAAVAFSAFERR